MGHSNTPCPLYAVFCWLMSQLVHFMGCANTERARACTHTHTHTHTHKTSPGAFELTSYQVDGPYKHLTDCVSDTYNVHSPSLEGCQSVHNLKNE
jgi:hypothetical protein